jgi:hypothetical protein
MRLGLKKTLLKPDVEWSKIRAIYARTGLLLHNDGEAHSPQPSDPSIIMERHRYFGFFPRSMHTKGS